MNEEHKNTCEKLYDMSRSILKEKGFVPPAFFIFQQDKVILVPLPKELEKIKDDDSYKYACFQFAQQACIELKGDALVQVTEAWVASGSKEEMDKYTGRPSEHPNRQENLMVVYVTPYGERQLFTGKFVKTSDTNERVLEEGEWIQVTHMPLAGDSEPTKQMLQ